MEYDNTKPVVLRNPNNKKADKVLTNNTGSNKTNFGSMAGKKLKDDEDYYQNKLLVGKETGLKISKARLAKNLKQKDVAKYVKMVDVDYIKSMKRYLSKKWTNS